MQKMVMLYIVRVYTLQHTYARNKQNYEVFIISNIATLKCNCQKCMFNFSVCTLLLAHFNFIPTN